MVLKQQELLEQQEQLILEVEVEEVVIVLHHLTVQEDQAVRE